MWEVTIPQLAFESEIVLCPVLALAALHAHAHAPDDSGTYLVLCKYLDKALSYHRKALANIQGEFGEHFWLSAVILSQICWVVTHQKRPCEEFELPLQAFEFLSSLSKLITSQRINLNRLGYAWYGLRNDIDFISAEQLSLQGHSIYDEFENNLNYLFSTFHVDEAPQHEQKVYHDARKYILSTYRAYFSGVSATALRRFIGVMPLVCGNAYMELLKEHDPLAMALYSHLLVLLSGFEPRWWMNGKGPYDVLEQDLHGISGLMPTHFAHTMEWPLRVLRAQNRLVRPGADEWCSIEEKIWGWREHPLIC